MKLASGINFALQAAGGLSSPLTGLGSETGAVTSADTILSALAKAGNDRLRLSGGTLTGDVVLATNVKLYRGSTGTGSYISFGGSDFSFYVGNTFSLQASALQVRIGNIPLSFNNEVQLQSGGSNVLSQRNGAAAQEFRIFGTYTSASIYERLAIRTDAGDYMIAAEAAGGGTLRNLLLNGANRSAYIASPTATEIRDILIAWGLMAAS